ncbi:MAG: hypothetical protein GWN93_26875 [Deltaproteobacteria bacterium]|nr:hypothetical protein [Deltaproteobacteria bacterium]
MKKRTTREINFRVWDGEKMGAFHKPSISDEYGILCFEPVDYSDTINSFLDTEKYEFMQFTGLKDRNSKEIYEGDIVEFDHEILKFKGIGVVQWDNDGCWVCRPKERKLYFTLSSTSSFKVIGNIQQNPELLETKEASNETR